MTKSVRPVAGDDRKQLRDAALLAAYLACSESDDQKDQTALKLIRPRITDPGTAADNYGQMADRLYDEAVPAIQQLLYSYAGRRLNDELYGLDD